MGTTTVTLRQRTGLVLGGLVSLSTIPSAFASAPQGEVGPPLAVMVLDTVMGVVGLVAAVLAWRGRTGWLRLLAASLAVTALSGVPAFFVDVPLSVKAIVGASILVTVAIVALLFPSRPTEANTEEVTA
jgi:hypothetical protein